MSHKMPALSGYTAVDTKLAFCMVSSPSAMRHLLPSKTKQTQEPRCDLVDCALQNLPSFSLSLTLLIYASSQTQAQ